MGQAGSTKPTVKRVDGRQAGYKTNSETGGWEAGRRYKTNSETGGREAGARVIDQQ